MNTDTKYSQNFRCKICSKDFHFSTTKFLNHLKTHVSSQNLKNKTRKVYKDTMKKDHTKKKYECDICQKDFRGNDTLRNHNLSVHQNIKSFQCDLCNQFFTQKVHVQKHKLKVHENVKGLECGLCDRKFNQRGNLNIHVKKVSIIRSSLIAYFVTKSLPKMPI